MGGGSRHAGHVTPKDLGKRLAYVLRHRPESMSLVLDRHGWVAITDVLAGFAARGHPLTLTELLEGVRSDDKGRFTIAEGRVRAAQGHSVPVVLALSTVMPPEQLFHGTGARVVPRILREGLLPGKRHDVHLSIDRATAASVAARRREPVVLTIDAMGMHRAGHLFRLSENRVWLVPAVPPGFILRESLMTTRLGG